MDAIISMTDSTHTNIDKEIRVSIHAKKPMTIGMANMIKATMEFYYDTIDKSLFMEYY